MNDAVTLEVRGIGNPPSFKNCKRVAGKKLITEPYVKQWMDRCTRVFEYQLRSILKEIKDGTSTGLTAQSLIAWSKQFDDSRQWMKEVNIVDGGNAVHGSEGFRLTLELC